jgi:GNAT superfamily N-acetyltransferase
LGYKEDKAAFEILRNSMQIAHITGNKKQYLDLLLLGDEQESMIERYLEDGDLFALYDDDLRAVCVVIHVDNDSCELKNIAVYEQYQGKGYGSYLMEYLSDYYKNKYNTMFVGTGETPSTLSFYKRCGFEYSHRIDNFFTNNYDYPIVEEGVRLVDMIYLKKNLK